MSSTAMHQLIAGVVVLLAVDQARCAEATWNGKIDDIDFTGELIPSFSGGSFKLFPSDVIHYANQCDIVELPFMSGTSAKANQLKKVAVYSEYLRKLPQCASMLILKLKDQLQRRWNSVDTFILAVHENSTAPWVKEYRSQVKEYSEVPQSSGTPKLALLLIPSNNLAVERFNRSSPNTDLFKQLNNSGADFNKYADATLVLKLAKLGSRQTTVSPPSAVQSDNENDPSDDEVTNGKETNDQTLRNFSKTSVLFVSISFIILMVISLAWLVFYYVQRFRYAHAKDRLARRLFNAAKKALAKIPTKPLVKGDKELDSDCPVCIDPYRSGDVVRVLPCRHIFHKTCVDPWLLEHRTCPMCKTDILKAFGFNFNTVEDGGGAAGGGANRGTGAVGAGGGLTGIDEADGSDRSSDDGRPSSANGSSYGNYPYPGIGTDSDTHDPFSFSPGNSPTLVQQVIHQGNVQGFSIIPLTVHSAVVTRPASTGNLIARNERTSNDSSTNEEAHQLAANKSHHSAEVHHPPLRTNGIPQSHSSTSAEDAGSEGSTPEAEEEGRLTNATTATNSVSNTPDPPACVPIVSGVGGSRLGTAERPRSIFKPRPKTVGSSGVSGTGGIPVSLREVKEVTVEPSYSGLTPVSKLDAGGSRRSLNNASLVVLSNSTTSHAPHVRSKSVSESAPTQHQLDSSGGNEKPEASSKRLHGAPNVVTTGRPATAKTFQGKTKRGHSATKRRRQAQAAVPATVDSDAPDAFASLESL